MNESLILQLLVNGAVNGCVYALIGLSFGVIYTTTRTFHLAHATAYTLAAYIAVVGAGAGWPIPLTIAAAILGAIAFGAAVELGVYAPMRKRAAGDFTMFLASLGISIVIANLLLIKFGSRSLVGWQPTVRTVDFGGITVTSTQLVQASCAALTVVVTSLVLYRTQFGKALAAVSVNGTLAQAVGISRHRMYLAAFGIGSALIALASLLFMTSGAATPSMGLAPILLSMIAVFLGGPRVMIGGAFGGFVLGLLSSLASLWFSGDVGPIVVFAILYVSVIARPQGLVSGWFRS